MATRKVRVWKHHPWNRFYAEISNGCYSGTLFELELDENRKIRNVSNYGDVSWAGEKFFDDCTLISKPIRVYYSEHSYPWDAGEEAVWKAVTVLYGSDMIIPRKFETLKQPIMTDRSISCGDMRSPTGTW